MSWWMVAAGVLLGAGLGYVGARLAPRWMAQPPARWATYAAMGACALLSGLLAARHGLGDHFWAQVFFLAVLTVASFVDLHDRIIPNEVVIFGLLAGLVLMGASVGESHTWYTMAGGAAAGFGFLLLLALLVKGGMGLGDVKLAAVMGLFLGWPWIWLALVLSFLAGGLVSVAMLALGRVGRKQHIPFGPFLALGSALTAIYGPDIWAWYLGY